MLTRRGLLVMGGLLGGAGCLSTADSGNGDGGAGPSFSSPAFTGGTSIPSKYTCDGEDVSPPLRLRGTPDTESLALLVDDPDAPTDDPFVHWLVWNVPPEIEDIPEAIPREPTVKELGGAVQGTNDFGDLGYRGPCPPADDGKHTYQFTIQLVDTILDLDPGPVLRRSEPPSNPTSEAKRRLPAPTSASDGPHVSRERQFVSPDALRTDVRFVTGASCRTCGLYSARLSTDNQKLIVPSLVTPQCIVHGRFSQNGVGWTTAGGVR